MSFEFDYLIVGGGTAGCVLAGELYRYQAGSIVVIESGRQPLGSRIHTPALYNHTFGSHWDERWITTPQVALRGRKIPWPRGRMLGGCSGINAMIYSRGSPGDFDRWPDGWQYADNLKYFRSIEGRLFGCDPCDVSRTLPQRDPPLHPLSERFLMAGQQAGFQLLDENGIEAKSGVCRFQRTQHLGRRQTTFSEFLKPTPVKWIENARVEKVILRDQVAVGVRLKMEHEFVEIRARKAIVLAAGAIHSPLILQRSGIGPNEVLRRCNIEPKLINDRVGENLQDHLVFPLIFAARGIDSMVALTNRQARLEYAKHRTGPLTSNIAEVGGFSLLTTDRASLAVPEIQWHFTPTHCLEHPTREDPANAWSISVTLLHPNSRGRLYVEADAPMSATIDPAYLSHPLDLESTISAIQLSKQLADQPALAEYRSDRLVPRTKEDSRERLEAAIRAYSTTIYHPLGTCAMGSPGQSVVDGRLRVHGLANLYVADASVIPDLPSANPQATVMMIGSRMACILASPDCGPTRLSLD